MGCEVLFLEGCYIDGEQPLYASAADYVAGMAAKNTANGVDVASSHATVNGIMKNDGSVDQNARNSPQVGDSTDTSDLRCAVIKGVAKVKMTPGTLRAGTVAAPFIFPGSAGGGWAVGNKMYVTAAGKWDNTPIASEQPFGTVTKIPASATDSLEADMVFTGGV